MPFPQDFVWGAATAAFQIEGGAQERGDCVWDMFCRREGAVAFGHNGLEACDHYHRFREDVRIMKELGIKAYRFSFCWPRIFPEGLGRVNEAGVRFYNELIDELLANGIVPYATLFHWEYPTALYRKGGWLNPDSPKWFGEYTKKIMELYSDRISHWFTLNEHQCFLSLGHANGEHAPGLRLSEEDVLIAAHNSLLAHGEAVSVIRKYAKTKPVIGFAPVGDVKIPASDSPEDIEAAYEAMFKPTSPSVYWGNAMWVDPIMTGRYQPEIAARFAHYGIDIPETDMKLMSQPIDFLGMNIYLGQTISQDGPASPKVGFDQTMMGWEVTPSALYWGTKFYYQRYKLPMYITENGMANNDVISADGRVHDPQRIEYLRSYISGLKKSSEEGADIRGYFHWSLLDNFEWGEGYQKRFGIVYVDYPTKNRILKDSAHWYSDVIRTNGQEL